MNDAVVLVSAPSSLSERYGLLAPFGSTLPNLGLLSLAAVLRREDFSITIIDAAALGLTADDIVRRIKQRKPAVVGISCVTMTVDSAGRLAGHIKQSLPDTRVFIGGPHVSALPQQTLLDRPGFDYGVVGEGEIAFLNAVRSITTGGGPEGMPGIVFRRDTTVTVGPRAGLIEKLDSLPFPAWDLLEGFPGRYHPSILKSRRLPSTHVVTSRGCPHQCIFCDTSVFGRTVRFHSAEYVLDLLQHLALRFGIRDVTFEDDQFLLDRPRVEKICEGIRRRLPSLTWSCNGRVNSITDPEFPRLLRASGCRQINFGIESGDQAVLDAVRKGITLSQVGRAVDMVHRAGIQSRGYFILGFPGDTPETVRRTIRFARRLPLDDISVFMLTPFPGSEIYRRMNQEHGLTGSFDKMNVLTVITAPRRLNEQQLRSAYTAFLRAFYLRPRALPGLLATLWRMAPPAGRLAHEFLRP